MKISNRLHLLRQSMKKKNIDIYVVPSADFHQSEYVGDHFKSREFITGFTGSSGLAVITSDYAGLWTDGRYFIQAEKELRDTEIKLNKMGLSECLSVNDFLLSALPESGTLAFDGRVVSFDEGSNYEKIIESKNGHVKYNEDLLDEIWQDRPLLSKEPVFLLSEELCGESRTSKFNRIRNAMRTSGASAHLLSSLDDIAWLLNIRGNDVKYTPVALCYLWITLTEIHLFIDECKIPNNVRVALLDDGIVYHPYNEIFQFLQFCDTTESVMIDPSKISYSLYHSLPAAVTRIASPNPSLLLKAQKNETEIRNTKNAHLKDAIAHTKFLYWLKTNYQTTDITELDAAQKLEELRSEQEHFISPSFETISAFASHAAMCHYTSSPETNVVLKEGSFYLTDSGGHYLDGSTDITRTIALGTISKDLQQDYTNVLKGNLALSKANFLYGCSGENLDILARQFLWSKQQDYMHGTGHGVGNLLSIHEGPCNIKWRYRTSPIPLENGMILSNEPGLYIENSHGIRLENELLVRKGINNMYGQFMYFETLTYVPFDLDAIDESMLGPEEKAQLNAYHKKVYELVSPHLNSAEKEWLKQNTREL